MKEPIKAGDICEVVGGLGRNQSPNLGLRVTVGHRIVGAFGMDHTQFGPVVRCTGKGVVQLGDAGQYVKTGWADFPVEWLKKIEPDAPPVEGVTIALEAS
jgi:hypothetical protein